MFSATQGITLLSDFGLTDPYVGQMKGAILRRNPRACLVDICHGLPPQDILAAALALHGSFAYFPPGTIHIAVVDPGVGTQRHILVAASAEHLFIAPDNGVLSLLLQEQELQIIRRLTNPLLYAPQVSATFHGRDIMAPAAAALADGFPLEAVGPVQEAKDCVCLPWPPVLWLEEGLEGKVLYSDHFGNMRTNIRRHDLARLTSAGTLRVGIKGESCPLLQSYAEAPEGSLLALLDSGGFLELAVNKGSAAARLACLGGETVRVEPIPQQGTGRQA